MEKNFNSEFLLDIFARFGKEEAQDAIDFVRKNTNNNGEIAKSVVDKSKNCIVLPEVNSITTNEDLTHYLGDIGLTLDYSKLFAIANDLNTRYIRAICSDDSNENYLRLDSLGKFSGALLWLAECIRKADSAHDIEYFQRTSFEAVDLGLPSGTKWANKNVGADYSHESGLYFNFDDANAIIFNDNWHLPTKEQFKELVDNCTYTFTKSNGVNGMLFKSKINKETIFFPCSGVGSGTSWNNRWSNGRYWSSSRASATTAHVFYFNSGGVYPQDMYSRFYGRAVRAVQ